MDALVSLCKRRGFIYPSSEIYGGLNGFFDYGPLGAELKRNIRNACASPSSSVVTAPASPYAPRFFVG